MSERDNMEIPRGGDTGGDTSNTQVWNNAAADAWSRNDNANNNNNANRNDNTNTNSNNNANSNDNTNINSNNNANRNDNTSRGGDASARAAGGHGGNVNIKSNFGYAYAPSMPGGECTEATSVGAYAVIAGVSGGVSRLNQECLDIKRTTDVCDASDKKALLALHALEVADNIPETRTGHYMAENIAQRKARAAVDLEDVCVDEQTYNPARQEALKRKYGHE